MRPSQSVPDVLGWVTDALQSAASLGYSPAGTAPGAGAPEDLFRESLPLLRLVGELDDLAFVAVEEDGVSFRVAVADPPERRPEVEAEVLHQAESGMFAWSLYQRRPVVVAGKALGRSVVLHVVATPSRVLGMLVGSHREASSFQSAVSQQLLSVVLSRMATVLETARLHGELASYNARLEALVEERTRELRRSEAEARAASRAKGDFLANMSHEIRTPIHGIMGFTRLVLESELESEPREYAEIVLRSAESLLAIVNDLLDFAKVEAGRLQMERSPFDLRQALEDVVGLVAPRVAGTVELTLDYAADVPRRLVGDAGRIRQVVLNLVANAVRFTAAGHVTVRARGGEGSGISIAVEDTGVGIPPGRVEAMFEKFTQGEAKGGKGNGGTGLGLSIARALARAMDGDVTGVSAPDAGSTFTFTFPFAGVGAASEDAKPLAGSRVAVVTASPRLAASLGGILERGGADFEVLPADSVVGLLTGLVGSARPCALLVDGALGPEALLRVGRMAGAAHAEAAPLRCLALLDADAREADAWLRSAGYAGSIPKPVRESRLVAALLPGRAAPPGVRSGAAAAFAGARVLLADDDEISRRLGVHMLEGMGCEVTSVENGLDALHAARHERFDVVLLDGNMPGMDGYDVARTLRACERDGEARPPILALTASATPADRERALKAGMDDHVPKPVSPEVLAAAIARWIPAASGGGPRPEPPPPPRTSDEELDVAEALRRVGGSREFLEAQVRLFLDSWPGLKRRMVEACRRGDTAELAALAHRLKGGAGSLAANRVYRLAAAIEAAAHPGAAVVGLDVVEGLDHAVERVRTRAQALDWSGEAA